MPLSIARSLAGGVVLLLLTPVFAPAQNEEQFTPKQRIARIRDLGKRHADALPALTAYLTDPDREIRVEAVKAITKIGGEESLSPLLKATADSDSEVQIRATDGITNFYVPGYVAQGLTGPVTRGLRQAKSVLSVRNNQVIDPSVTVRADIPPALAAEIGGTSSDAARANAARSAGILRAQGAVPALAASLRAHDSQLILECLVALQKIKDPSAGPSVTPVVRDLDEKVKITALETVGLLRSLPSAPEVRTAFTGAKNDKVRRAALSALAFLGLADDRSLFLQHLDDSDSALRVAALEGLGRIRNPDDYPVLEKAYNEQNAGWEIHLAAAFALVSEGKVDTSDYSPLPYLVENLSNKTRAENAGAYLAELARRDDVQTGLLSEASKANRDQKLALCPVLGESRSPKVTPVLQSLQRDIDPDVALAASRALKLLDSHS
jgi:HEAT repeat protein